ncbi:MAG: QcrA and Rieske domain-containing protein [Trichloromonadaceae bacterium]
MENFDRARRGALKTLIALAGLGLFWKYLTPEIKEQQALLRVASGDLPSGGALVYRESRIALMRDRDEIYALSLVCTHLGCTVTVLPERLICPCHGSSFDRNGRVLEGPARLALKRLSVVEREGFLEVLG